MESYFREQKGTQTTVSSYDGFTSSSETLVDARRQSLSVSNGLAIGNFRDPNPISFTRVVQVMGNRSSYRHELWNGHTIITIVNGPAPPGANFNNSNPVLGQAEFGRTRDNALEKVFAQLRNGPNLAVDWAERAQTGKLLRNAVSLQRLLLEVQKAVTGSTRYKRLPKGDAGVQERLDLLSQKWLEYRYGWTPLVHSIYDIVNQVRASFIKPSCLFYVKGRSSQSSVMSSDEWSLQEGDGSYNFPLVKVQGTFKYRSEMAFYFNVPQGAALSDFTSLNPLIIAWELTPYSFVADWFLNVSQYLSNWENWVLFNQHCQGGYVTDSFQEISIWSAAGSTNTADVTSSVSLRGTKRISYKNRERVLNLPFPSGIRLSVNLNAKRVADAAALLFGIANRSLPDLPGIKRSR